MKKNDNKEFFKNWIPLNKRGDIEKAKFIDAIFKTSIEEGVRDAQNAMKKEKKSEKKP